MGSRAAAEGNPPLWLRHLWPGLFAATLVTPTVIALTEPDRTVSDKIQVLVMVVVLALTSWLVVVRHRHWWEPRISGFGVYWSVVCGVLAALAVEDESFTIAMYSVYPMVFLSFSWLGLLPIVTIIFLTGRLVGSSNQDLVTNLLADAGLAALVGVLVNAVAWQNQQHRDTVAAAQTELGEERRRAVLAAERKRPLQELNDTMTRGLTSVVTHLESVEQELEHQAGPAADRARAALRPALTTARDRLDESGRTVPAPPPDPQESRSLPDTLTALVRLWSAETGVPVELMTKGDPGPLHPDAELALLRTVQEALANVRRHARAGRVTVTLSYFGFAVTLDVDDDGVGFGPLRGGSASRVDRSSGLADLEERLAAVGGLLLVTSAPGKGATVAAHVSTERRVSW